MNAAQDRTLRRLITMEKLVEVRELFRNTEKYIDQVITVGGWIRSNRDSKTFGFAVISDGTFFNTLQIVYHDKLANFQEIAKLNIGAAIIAKGKLVATPDAKQPFEIQADPEGLQEDGAEVYSIATKKEQAKIVWDESKRMIKKSPELNELCRCRINGIFYDYTESVYKALASDSDSLDGLNSYCVIADEVHAWRDKNLMDVMYDSMSAREQPLFIELSTMGQVRENVFDNEYQYCCNIINEQIKDETVLPIIYELDKADEWQTEESWYKANPRTRNNQEHKRR
jgi:hypothetical protein